ncbi:hypothetical protein MsAc7_07120 [Methanolapillus millepedarum]|uniref:Uncharacterized protein n=1 Tax=Methanolapillus millepedarum TaxID=3028296 RepID=A0AA96V450_9EURY|nr:hypothetical protein MsAc7_07120 [Methanosarcinaceae archaeon Ac7]
MNSWYFSRSGHKTQCSMPALILSNSIEFYKILFYGLIVLMIRIKSDDIKLIFKKVSVDARFIISANMNDSEFGMFQMFHPAFFCLLMFQKVGNVASKRLFNE